MLGSPERGEIDASLPRRLLIGLPLSGCGPGRRRSAPTIRSCRSRSSFSARASRCLQPASSSRPRTCSNRAWPSIRATAAPCRYRPRGREAASVRQGDPDDQQGAAARAERCRCHRRPGRSDGRARRDCPRPGESAEAPDDLRCQGLPADHPVVGCDQPRTRPSPAAKAPETPKPTSCRALAPSATHSSTSSVSARRCVSMPSLSSALRARPALP